MILIFFCTRFYWSI